MKMGAHSMVLLFERIASARLLIRQLLTPIGPFIFFGFIAAMIYLARQFDLWLGLPVMIPEPWSTQISRPFMFAGLVIMAWSASYFFRAKGTPVPFNPPRSLVTTGPFVWSRNPMMMGLFSVLFGLGIRLQSLVVLAGFLPIFIFMIRLQVCKVEEVGLERRFGQAYLDYKAVTPRFFPRVKTRMRKS